MVENHFALFHDSGRVSACSIDDYGPICTTKIPEYVCACDLTLSQIDIFSLLNENMEVNLANQQDALSGPAARCEPATKETADIEFEIRDVESQIVVAASALAAKAHIPSVRDYLVITDQLSSVTRENQLKLFQIHHGRLQTAWYGFRLGPAARNS